MSDPRVDYVGSVPPMRYPARAYGKRWASWPPQSPWTPQAVAALFGSIVGTLTGSAALIIQLVRAPAIPPPVPYVNPAEVAEMQRKIQALQTTAGTALDEASEARSQATGANVVADSAVKSRRRP